MSRVRARPFIAATTIIAVGCLALAPTPRPAAATVRHQLGFEATVAGHSSWYGSYDMGPLGSAWCIDHGIAAPDPGLDYRPTQPAVSPTTRTALAWLVGRHGFTTDRTTAAAVMLAVHDLMGATYPTGRLDVDRLAAEHLAGFAGAESSVIERARALKAEALAHGALVAPLAIALDAEATGEGERGELGIRITDAAGHPVSSANLLVNGMGADLDATHAESDHDGTVRVGFHLAGPTATFTVHAAVADLELATFEPTVRRAQRVIVPRQVVVEASLDIVAAPDAPGRVTVHKTGDATDIAPITGAVFELRSMASGGAVSELVIGTGGSAGPVEVEPGSYELIEVTPPPGYLVADPQRVEVRTGEEVAVEVYDRAAPGSLSIAKIDADDPSGQPLAGAVLEVFAGHPDLPESPLVATVETTETSHPVPDLAHGTYWIVERTAPTGFEPVVDPLAVEVLPGKETPVRLANRRSLPDVVPPEPSPPADVAPAPTTTSTSTSITSPPTTTTTMPVDSAPQTLPRTGATTVPTSLVGAGLVFLGLALTLGADIGPDGRIRPRRRFRRPPRPRRRPGQARSSGGGRRTRRSRHRPSRARR